MSLAYLTKGQQFSILSLWTIFELRRSSQLVGGL